MIKDAPNIEDSGHLTEAQEQDLYDHYNVPYSTEGSTFADTSQLGRTSQSDTCFGLMFSLTGCGC